MLRLGHRARDDRGAAALLIAAGMVLFLGMAAMAIDVGFAFNERRQDQSSADAGVMAGALSTIAGTDTMVSDTLQYVQVNLPTTYTAAEWQTSWETCVDPAAERNAGGFSFTPLDPPAGWTVSDPANWCISMDASESLFRVRLPAQFVDTSFGKVLGVDRLQTGAFATAKITTGGGGILPFGIPAGAGDGGLICLSDAPGGVAIDPCNGPIQGNFGTISLLKFGNSEVPTNPNCNASGPGNLLAQNIAHGADHLVFLDADGLAANEVRDSCFLNGVDTLQTDTGFPNNGLEQGMVGPVPPDGVFTYPARLTQSPPLVTKLGFQVNNRPLWDFLDPSSIYGTNPLLHDAPDICAPSTFNNGMQDWDGDGNPDRNRSWQHMQACIDGYRSGGFNGVFFRDTVATNVARFGYIPEFWGSLGPGASWENIRYFRAVYLQTLMWKKQGGGMAPTNHMLSSPGEPCWDAENGNQAPTCNPPANWSVEQITAFVLPDDALPESLRGSSLAGSTGVNPFSPELYR